MYQMILIMSLFPTQPEVVAQVQPCVWPRICAQQAETVAQVQPCVWPRICSQTQAAPIAAPAKEAEASVSETPVKTCEYPNKCA